MDCKEVQSLLSKFIDGTCTREQTKEMREHILNCPDCREELTIQFLVQEGMARVDRDEDFNLDQEIDQFLSPKRSRHFSLPFSWNVWTILLDALSVIVVVAFILYLLFH